MPQKNKPQNPSTFRMNANPGVKCEKRKKGSKMWKKVKIVENKYRGL